MSKSPEEGLIWEWRAFGRIDEALAARVRKYPIRGGVKEIRGEDIYLIAPPSDQNIKLRRYPNGWLLKLKLLLETRSDCLELYRESAQLTYAFPVEVEQLRVVARLLGVTLPPTLALTDRVADADFVRILEQSSPSVSQTNVTKQRTQFQFEGGWLELARIEFPTQQIDSVSIHSPELETVESMIIELSPGKELEAMNYIEACRRWS